MLRRDAGVFVFPTTTSPRPPLHPAAAATIKRRTRLVVVSPQSLDCLLEPSVCILRKLLFADPPLRRSLARRSPLLLALLRGAFARQLIK